MNDPAPLVRRLFQHVRTQANLPALQPRPLPAQGIVAGSSEFVITRAPDDGAGGGWGSGGLLLPTTYQGYIAVHYAADTDQHNTLSDHAAILRALQTFGDLDAVASDPHWREMGPTPADWFLNQEPTKVQLPPVLTLSFDFSLQFDLTLQEGQP